MVEPPTTKADLYGRTEQANLHRQIVPCQIEEHEMPSIADFRIEVCISKPRAEGVRVFCQRVIGVGLRKAWRRRPTMRWYGYTRNHACRVKA